ncbi:MAG: DUF4352 domain-containing protein [Candidatus Obscuribacterales bacterium]|nr:DUF4352 domain-containing protein [Candidatus Obscuribacterales bacterium]
MLSARSWLIISVSFVLALPVQADENTSEPITEGTKLKGSVEQTQSAKDYPFLDGVVQTVPKGTNVALRLSCNLNSELSSKGDEIFAKVCVDVKDGQKVLMPGGWHLHGIVSDSKKQRRLGRSGYVEVTFDKLLSENGYEVDLPTPVKFSTRDNQLKAVAKILAVDAAHVGYGAVGGAILSAELGSIPLAISTYGISIGVGATAGATVGMLAALKRKGKIASIYPGDPIRLTIAEQITLPGFNPEAIPSAVKPKGIPGVSIKTGKVTYGKSPIGDDNAKQMTIDLTIDNRSNKEVSFFDIAVVDDYEEKNFPTLYGNYLPFGKHVAQGTTGRATLSFPISRAKRKYSLVLLDRSKRNELMRVPIN